MSIQPFLRLCLIAVFVEAILVAIIAPNSAPNTPIFYATVALLTATTLTSHPNWWRIIIMVMAGAPIAVLGDRLLGYFLNGDPFGMAHAITGPMNWISFLMISTGKYVAFLLSVLALSWLASRALNKLKRPVT